MYNEYNLNNNSFVEYQLVVAKFQYQIGYLDEIQLSLVVIDGDYETLRVKVNKDH